MDFNALQHKLFAIDPSDPAADKQALIAQAGGGVPETPTIDYVNESVDVMEGSMPIDLDLAGLTALAGVRLDEKQKHGDYARGKDPMPKAKPGRTKHPLKDKLVGEAPQGFKAGFAGYNKVDPWLGSDSDSKPTNTKTEPKADPKADPKAKVDTKPAPQPKRNTGGWPTSQEGYTLKQGDLVDYNNANGKPRTKTEVVDLIPGKKDRNGHPQIQLTLRGATYAISRDQITAVNGKPFTLTNAEAGTGTIKDQLLNALEAYKSKPIKPRDPNSQAMNDLRKSGAMGAHKDKKKVLPRKEKHKGKMDESSKNLDAMDAEKLRKKYAKDWEVRKGKYLYKKVAFDDYNTVLRFLMVIEKPQIELDHFANIKFFYNEAELVVYTHDTNGLTVLDFKLAVQMDKALERMGAKEIG